MSNIGIVMATILVTLTLEGIVRNSYILLFKKKEFEVEWREIDRYSLTGGWIEEYKNKKEKEEYDKMRGFATSKLVYSIGFFFFAMVFFISQIV